jgi:hypothetical protein
MFLFASCNIPYISSYQIYSFTIFVRTNEHATQSTFRNALDDCPFHLKSYKEKKNPPFSKFLLNSLLSGSSSGVKLFIFNISAMNLFLFNILAIQSSWKWMFWFGLCWTKMIGSCQLPKSIIWTWFQWEKTITQNKSSPHPSPPYPRKSTGCPLITRVTMFLFASCNIPWQKNCLLSVYKENRAVFPSCIKIWWQSSKAFRKVDCVACSLVRTNIVKLYGNINQPWQE